MTTDNVTSIARPGSPPAPPSNPTFEVIENRAETVRELIFQAQAIVELAMRAAMANESNPDWVMKNALGSANGMLDEAATLLEPAAITAPDTANVPAA
jgi:hypothetical protein